MSEVRPQYSFQSSQGRTIGLLEHFPVQKSMRYMHRNRSAQSQMMFIFSADNFAQMYRRLRFMREYAAYQHVQGDEVKAQQVEVNQKFQEISVAKDHKAQLLCVP